MGGMKRELERIAETLLVADYETALRELQKLEELAPLNAHLVAGVIDTMKLISPNCKCGENYFDFVAPFCVECSLVRVPREIYEEELGMCVECSHNYFTHEEEVSL